MQYTEEQKKFLIDYIPGHHRAEIVEAYNNRFNAQINTDHVKKFSRKYSVYTGFTGRFEKGRTPINKGKKQTEFMSPEAIERSSATRFKKGETPHNHKCVGSERIDVDGFIMIKVKEPNTWRHKHKVVYEKTYGEIPEGHVIIFKDNNKLNCSPENLLCITKKEHCVMNKKGLYKYTNDLKETSLLIAKASIKMSEAKRKGKKNGKSVRCPS